MLGLGTLARVAREVREDLTAAQDRDPAARSVGRARDPADLRRRAGAAGPPGGPRAARAGVPLAPRVLANASRVVTGVEIHPAAEIGDALFIDHGAGRGDRRDGRDRRQRDALPGRDAGRHRLRARQAPSRRWATTWSSAPAPSCSARSRWALRARSARTPWSSTTCPPNSTVVGNPGHPVRVDGTQARGPGRRLGPPARPGGRRAQGAGQPRERARGSWSPSSPGKRARAAAEVRPLRRRRGGDPAGG